MEGEEKTFSSRGGQGFKEGGRTTTQLKKVRSFSGRGGNERNLFMRMGEDERESGGIGEGLRWRETGGGRRERGRGGG